VEKDVLISIIGKEDPGDPRSGTVSLITDGTFRRSGQSFIADFDETIITGLADTHTTLEIGPKSCSFLRTGRYPGHMLFEKGRRLHSLCDYGEGLVEMSIFTGTFENNIDENGGTLELRYDVEIEGTHVGSSRLKIDIKSTGDRPGATV